MSSIVKDLVFVGVGFGPSNIGLAIALEERLGAAKLEARLGAFLERQPRLSWHPGLMLPDAKMQVPFLKDLVTQRNPRSRFSFVAYLHDQNRLTDFINLRSLYPTRQEFEAYLRWCAASFRHITHFDTQVVGVKPCQNRKGRIVALTIETRCGARGTSRTYRTRNLVLATGAQPKLPDCMEDRPPCQRAFHSSHFVFRMRDEFRDPGQELHFIVVGSGQSAGDIILYLLKYYRNATITVILSGYALQAQDDNHFVNELYYPDAIDWFYHLAPEERTNVLRVHRTSNYSVIDRGVLEQIFAEVYAGRNAGKNRLRFLRHVRLVAVEDKVQKLVASYCEQPSKAMHSLPCDALIFATGFQFPRRHPLLEALDPYLESTKTGYRIERNYQIRTSERLEARVFLQGTCELTHGLSDSALSVLPFRVDQVAKAICDAVHLEPCDAFMNGRRGRQLVAFSRPVM